MPTPTRSFELPLGVIRSAFGSGRCVLLIQPALFLHSEIAKLAPSLSPTDRAKGYWVFALPKTAVDVTGATFTLSLPAPAAVRASGHDTYDQAEAEYDRLTRAEAGRASVARGFRGLQQCGTED